MRRFRTIFAQLPIDPYLVAILATVGLGLVLPAQGQHLRLVNQATYWAICGLFFLYGTRLSPSALWSGFIHWRLQLTVIASTFLVFPLIGMLVGSLARSFLPAELAAGLIFLTLLPSTVQSSISFTSIAHGDVPAALCSASLSNLVGVVLTPLIASMIFPGTHGFSIHGIEQIGLQIGLPFALGQTMRPLFGSLLERHKAATALFDRGSILVIVYSAFCEGSAAGVWGLISITDLGIVLVLDLMMLAIVVLVTMFASRYLGFATKDEIAIVFCGSKKSMASGLPMANILFSAHAVALIVLPLMIFHQLQLLVCATLARRYAMGWQKRQRVSMALAV